MSIFDHFSSKSGEKKAAMDVARRRATELGWKLKKDTDDMIIIGFHDELGTENVFVKYCGKSNDEKAILEFTSEGLPLPEEMAQAALFGLHLLERNGEMLMGHWGIEEDGNDKYFSVFHTMVAEGMDTNEFKAAVQACLIEKKRITLEALQARLKK